MSWFDKKPPQIWGTCPIEGHGNEQVPITSIRLLTRFTGEFVASWWCERAQRWVYRDNDEKGAAELMQAGVVPMTYDDVLELHNAGTKTG